MNPSMKQKQSNTDQNVNSLTEGPVTGSNFKGIDPSVKKILCPALALPNETRSQVTLLNYFLLKYLK